MPARLNSTEMLVSENRLLKQKVRLDTALDEAVATLTEVINVDEAL